VADFLTSGSPLIKEQKIIAAVRSQEQADALSGLGVDVLQLDLRDEEAVTESILRYDGMYRSGQE
jgi:LmbE family N-acetylglucosaminyl deacetylase